MTPRAATRRAQRRFPSRIGRKLRGIFNERRLRILGHALLVVATVQTAYFVVANIALQTDAVRDVLRSSPGFAIEYRRAWTIVPTLVHTRDLYIRAQHDTMQWGVSLERCRFRVHLWALLARKLHISGIRGDGAAARVRPRLEPHDRASPQTPLLPAIRGYSSPPMRDTIPPPPSPDAKVWYVELVDAEIAFREIWLAEYHYVGATHASWRQLSGIVLDPKGHRVHLGRDVALAKSRLESYGGTVRLGSADLFEKVRARFSGIIHRFEVAAGRGLAFVHFLSGAMVVDATVPDLRTANYYLAGSHGTRLLGGRGTLQANIRLERGAEQPGSVLRLTFEDVAAAAGPLRIALPSSEEFATWTVTIVDGRPLGRLDSNIDAIRISAPERDVAPAIVKSLRLTLQTRMVDHSVLPTDMDVKVDLRDVAVPDLRLLNVLMPKGGGLRFAAGSTTARASLEAGANRANGTARISMKTHHFAMRAGDATIRGRVVAQAHASDIELRTSRAHLNASVEIQDATASPGSQKPWWGKIELSSGRLRFAPAFSWTSAVRADVLDVRPLFDRIAHGLNVPAWTRTLGNVQNLRLTGRLSAGPSQVSLHDVEARSGAYHVRAVARRSHQRTKAAILVALGAISVGIGVNGDDKDLVIIGAPSWFQTQLAKGALSH